MVPEMAGMETHMMSGSFVTRGVLIGVTVATFMSKEGLTSAVLLMRLLCLLSKYILSTMLDHLQTSKR